MHMARPAHRVRSLARLLIAGLLILDAPMARATELRDLAGWWISIDTLFAQLNDTGGVVPMEELLIIGGDGKVENRLMTFAGADEGLCRDKKYFCSDAPIAARARITVKGDQMTFSATSKPDYVIDDRPEIDLLLRVIAITGTRSWTAEREANGQRLALRPNLLNTTRLYANIPNRTFAKIEPERLRRLRSLLLARGISAAKHWRCFLGNATANDAGFAALRTKPPQKVPGFLDQAMKVSGYYEALQQGARALLPDDELLQGGKLGSFTVERFMTERVADFRTPSNGKERALLREYFKIFTLRVRGEPPGKAKLPFSDEAFAAFERAMSDDPEARQLFCLD